MKKVAFVHNALGKTDGVSLEVDKWREVFRELGHKVFYCAGNDHPDVYKIAELDFLNKDSYKIILNATKKLSDFSEKELQEKILKIKDKVKKKLLKFIKKYEIDILIPNNLLSVGINVPAILALNEIILETGIKTISHNHDFYFEDNIDVNPTCNFIKEIYNQFTPLNYSNVKNVVINKIAQEKLKSKKNIDSFIVPNVFDFDLPSQDIDDYNKDFKSSFDIQENDIVFLQATRVMNRKGIELAIDLIAEVQNEIKKFDGEILYNGKIFNSKSRLLLLCAGRIEIFGGSADYPEKLKKRAKEKNVNIKFIGDGIKHQRSIVDSKKCYSLFDTYAFADIVTFPSIWEGWGNQLIEAIHAKLPVVIFKYPVFKTDIEKFGFDLIDLGEKLHKDKDDLYAVPTENLKLASHKVIEVLFEPDKRTEKTQKNYKIACKNLSLEKLKEQVKIILDDLNL